MHYLSKSVRITIKAVMALKNILHASIFLSLYNFTYSVNVFYFPTELDLLGHLIETKRLKHKNIKWSNSNSSSREDKHSSEKLADS